LGLLAAAAIAACGHGTSRGVPGTTAAAAAPAGELGAHDVDEALRAAWKQAGVEPAPPVNDAGFLRRAWLDLAGVVPPPEAVSRFLADRSPDKRRAAVAELMTAPTWASHWANRWERLLLGPAVKIPIVDRDAFRDWVRDAFARNMPYDRFVEALVTATGRNTSEEGDAPVNGAVNWILRFRDAPEDLAGTTARVFLGTQIQCAQCHDHKTEKWTQADFRRFTACFMQVQARPVDKEVSKKELVVRDVDRPAFLRKGPKKLMKNPYAAAAPGALDGTDFSASPNRRKALAGWMIDPRNPYLARAFVNRVWDELLGRGIVDPVDDFRASNPPLLPDLLDRLAADFVAHGFDVRRLVALICDTEAYQLSSGKAAKGEGTLWSRYPLKALGPDELLDSIVAATGTGPLLSQLAGDDLEGLRADLRRQMTFLFDVDEQAGETVYQGTLSQALMLLNGRLVNGGASAIRGDALDAVLARGQGDAAAIEALYLRTLSRPPSPEEVDHWVRFVNAPRDEALAEGAPVPPRPASRPGAGGGGGGARAAFVGERRLARAERLVPRRETPKQQAYEDVLWALLNSSEFIFNH
jgi:hypothetical protein